MFNKRLQEVLTLKGITHYRLSKLTKIPSTTVSDIKIGKIKNPSLDVVIKIANGLNMSVSELIGEKEEKYTSEVKELADIALNLSPEHLKLLTLNARAFLGTHENETDLKKGENTGT